MRKLREDLAITPPDPLEIEEDKEWAAVVERATIRKQMEEEALRMALELEAKNKAAQADEDALTREHGDLGFTYQQRRDQFQRKIKSLEARLVTLTQERSEIDKKRIYATSQMRAKEKRMMALQLEKERLKEYPGSVVTSSVLVGADMQYNIADFRRRVEKAVEECMKDIAALKYAVITGENRRQQIKFDLERAADQRQERMAKFHEFESNFQKTMKIMKKFNGREADEKIKLLYFRRLQQHRVDRIALRAQIAHTFEQVQLRYLKIAFHLWKTGENDTSSHNTRAHRSVGGILLQRALEKREELQALLRVTMSETAVIKQKLELSTMSKENRQQLQQMTHFKQTEEGLDHVKLVKDRGLSLMYEGDAYAQENKFPLAIQCYEGQILLIRTAGRVAAMRQQNTKGRLRSSSMSGSATTTDVKGLALCHGRMGRLFTKMGNASRAIVEFDRQLSLAREIDDKAEESDAYYGLGAGYYQNYDYDNAIRYLSIAQAQYVSLGRVQRYILTLRLLKECYFRLNKPDKVLVYEEKLRDAESSAQTKLMRMHQRLDDMKGKLTHNAAEIELMVKIERTTYRALELRQYIASCDERVKALDTQIEDQEQRCLEIIALLEAIQQELTQAMETDALEMWSALVHDQPQVVEIEELKTRLKQRQQLEMKRLDSEREMKKTLLVRLKNVENDILEADQQLTLEDGALMKHARLERSFRCVGLCAANVAGNEVTGTATGGVEAFAASEGSHIHWIDYHSGELLHIFLGGNSDTGHVGIITCLLHDGAMLFSGGTDEMIICWDTVQRKMLRKLEGHEGSIVALASESRSWLISSAADTTMRLWEKHSGQLLRVLFGHAKSVLAMEIGPTWLLTGSADCELRVWKISTQEKVMQGQQSSQHGSSGGSGGSGGGLLLDKITPDSEYAPQLDYENIPAPPPLPTLNSAKVTAASPFDSKATIKGKKAKEQEAKAKEAQEKQRRLVEEARLKVLKEKEAAAAATAAAAAAAGGAAEAGAAAGAASPPRKKRGHHHYHRRPHHVTVDCVSRLSGHEVPITCVKYGNMEVLSGDVLGRIFIWWLSTGQILRKCQVHRGPVKAIQFDSVHIVSGGMDAAVAITDIATGEPLQSLRGHEKSILALAFDSERILSVGGDNTIRYWQWGKKAGPQDKLHVLGPSETLAMVAKQYQITVDNVMKWNGITESRQCHPGMKLIVKKGDPNALTHAEKVAAERELRRSRGLAWAAKKLARIGSGGSGGDDAKQQQAEAKRFHRVKSLALDQDPFSLNNRLFGREKRQLELFPDTTLAHEDDYSLAARIQAAADSGNAETSDAARIHQDRVQRQLQRAIRYFISVDNEDEWGSVGDELGLEMLQMMVELMAYECVIEAKNAQRSKFSVMGRIFIHQEQRRVAMLEAEAAAKKAAEDEEEAAAAAAAAAAAEGTGDDTGEAHDRDDDAVAPAAGAMAQATAVAVTATTTTAATTAAARTTTADADDDNSVKRRHRRTSIAEQRKRERKEQRHLRKSVTQTVVDAAREEVAAHVASDGSGLRLDEAEGQIVHSHARDTPAVAHSAIAEHQEAAAVAQMMDAYIEQLVASPSPSSSPPQPPVTSRTSRPSSGRPSSSSSRRGTAAESMPQPQPSSRSSSVSVKLPPLV